MKKEYVKPYIVVESFQLDAAIAGACRDKGAEVVLNHYESTCTLQEELPDLNYFGPACVDNVREWGEGGDGDDTLCYHGPIVDITSLFLAS